MAAQAIKSMQRKQLFDETFMTIAHDMARLSTCPRADVGAVLVRDRRILTLGFNGAPVGTPHCRDAGCRMEHERCVRAVHAEQNAIIQAALHGVSTQGSSLYCTHRPCLNCTKVLINAGITRIFFRTEYDGGTLAQQLLKQAGVFITQILPPGPVERIPVFVQEQEEAVDYITVPLYNGRQDD